MELCERIKLLRIKKSMTQRELSRKLGVSEVSISCWENGSKKPSMGAIVSLASLLDVTTDYLLGVEVKQEKDNFLLDKQEMTLLTNYRVLDMHGRKAVNAICVIEKERVESEKVIRPRPNVLKTTKESPDRYITRYSTPSAAGRSVPLSSDEFEMILADSSVPYNADFAVGIQGDSMYPYIHDGDTVYVKRDCDLSVGDIGIFCVDGSMYCKQYYIDENRNMTLVSANPELSHTNVYVAAESNSRVECYGKVLLDRRVELPDYIFD